MQLIEFNGELGTIAEWSRRLGVKPSLIRSRLAIGLPVEKALSPELFKRGPKGHGIVNPKETLTHGGRTMTIDEWAKEIGFDPGLIARRIKRGLPMEKVLMNRDEKSLAYSKAKSKMVTIDGKTQSIKDWAKELGLTLSGMSRRLSRGCKKLSVPKGVAGASEKPEYKKWSATRRTGATWTFEDFLKVVGPPPFPKSCLVRMDSSRPFGPDNFKWVSVTGGRASSVTKVLRLGDQSMSMRAWSLKLGMKETAVRQRLLTLKWPLEQALTLPKAKRGQRPPLDE